MTAAIVRIRRLPGARNAGAWMWFCRIDRCRASVYLLASQTEALHAATRHLVVAFHHHHLAGVDLPRIGASEPTARCSCGFQASTGSAGGAAGAVLDHIEALRRQLPPPDRDEEHAHA
ncbi:hypothetical protein [Streptomyces synnematoformans]|uniref:C2H2-type domain-containing protein n=1 Tax=Streptomyces synnematoformans TaxID=415721 RepID=A0ABN2X9N9_9ACTN